jgi:hypothetical protein
MQKLKKTYKGIPLWTIALLLCAGIVLAGTIVSNILHLTTVVQYPPPPPIQTPIELTYEGWPDSVTVGQTYMFTVKTKNLDPNYYVNNLVTHIEVWSDGGALSANMIYVHYDDGNWAGELPFTESEGKLVSTIGPWNAPIGYESTATITFRINENTNAPTGTWHLQVWVEQ